MRYRSQTSHALTPCPLSWMLVHAYSISFAMVQSSHNSEIYNIGAHAQWFRVNRHPCPRSGNDELPPIAHRESSMTTPASVRQSQHAADIPILSVLSLANTFRVEFIQRNAPLNYHIQRHIIIKKTVWRLYKMRSCCGSVDNTTDSQPWGPGSNLLAAAVVPLGKALCPHCLVPRKGLKAAGPLVACLQAACFLSGQVK